MGNLNKLIQMNKTKELVKAITEMNIDLLDLILDNNNSYLDVPKDAFLKELSREFKLLKGQGITKFNRISKGTCQDCFKGCSGYTFLTKNNDYLDLLIEEKDNTIIELTQCASFKNDEVILKEKNIFIYFKKDIRTSYIPSFRHLSQQNDIEKAEHELEKFENQIVDLEIIENWLNKWSELFNSVKHMILDYSFVFSFLETYHGMRNVFSLKKDNSLAKKALAELNNIDISNHKKVINWLVKYKESDVNLASLSYTKTDNWNKTNFLIFKNSEDYFDEGSKCYDNIIIDIKGYLDSIKFGEIYSKYNSEFYFEIEERERAN